MLSLGKLAAGAQQYYLDTVATGVEDYYTGAGEAPGRWTGHGATLLGLDGQVVAEDLHAVLEARRPGTGERLTRAQGAAKIPGFDATFTAPKSVSLLFALGSPEVSRQVRDAHELAVSRALEVLEAEAARARRGKGGVDQVAADGFVAAAFRHRTSRAEDPHLHTHVLIANVVHAPGDDRWSALDARPLYGWAKTAGYLYEAQLRAELTRRLGVEWEPASKGIADVAGFGRPVLREFSRRRRQIEAHLDERGQTSARAAQVATYATRQTKDATTPIESLVEGWRLRAGRYGLDQTIVDCVCGVTARHVPAVEDIERLFIHLAGPTGLTEHRSTFNRRDVIQAICDSLPAGADIDEITDSAELFLHYQEVARLGPLQAEQIRRSDGTLAPARVDDDRYTTLEMLTTEQHLVDGAMDRRFDRVAVAVPYELDRALWDRPSLSPEQRDMVAAICTSGAGVDIVEGVAGAGKTFALAAAHQAWTASGCSVTGVALAARAAQQLMDGSRIPSSTIDRLLADLERADARRLPDRHVLVVDEAAMVGTRKLLRLLDHAQRSQAKVVLVGDPRQLPEIHAGGAFAGLAGRLEASMLNDNRRQEDRWERDALVDLRAGDTDQALDTYRDHGRVHQAATADQAIELLVRDWLDAQADGPRPLLLAARVAQVDALNQRARQALQAVGVVGPDQLARGERRFAVGDTVMALRNDYRLDVLNGTRGSITAIDLEGQHITVVVDGRDPLVLPFRYIGDGDLTHGYAMTIHKAQGATAERAMLLADDTLFREHAYTGMSRGTIRNDLYLVVDDPREDTRHVTETFPDLDQAVRNAIRRSGAKAMAIDHPPTVPEPEPARRPPEPDRGIDLW